MASEVPVVTSQYVCQPAKFKMGQVSANYNKDCKARLLVRFFTNVLLLAECNEHY